MKVFKHSVLFIFLLVCFNQFCYGMEVNKTKSLIDFSINKKVQLSFKNQIYHNQIFIDKDIEEPLTLVKALAYEKLDKQTIYLFSHGRSGHLYIGGQWLHQDQLSEWIKDHFDISQYKSLNIYGCEFGKGEMGTDAIKTLEASLGLRVSASTDITGVDGNWVLEHGSHYDRILHLAYPHNLQINCTVNAGVDRSLCETMLQLEGNVNGLPDMNTLMWSQVSGPNTATFSTYTSLTPNISGLIAGTYTFRLSVTCQLGSAQDDVNITIYTQPIPVTPTANVPTCYTPGTPIQLTGAPPSGQTLSWNVQFPDFIGVLTSNISYPTGSTNPTVTINSLPADFCGQGPVEMIVTATTTAGNNCQISSSTSYMVNVDYGPINAYAALTNVCGTCNTLHATCQGTGTGMWTIVSQPSGSNANFNDGNAHLTTICGLILGSYTVRWTVSGNTCGNNGSFDVTFNVNGTTLPTFPDFGADPTIGFCQPIPSTITLTGITPNVGETVNWSVHSTPNTVTINNPNSVSTTVTGFQNSSTEYAFRYTITSGNGCSTSNVLYVYSKDTLKIVPENLCEITSGSNGFFVNDYLIASHLKEVTTTIQYISGPVSEVVVRQRDYNLSFLFMNKTLTLNGPAVSFTPSTFGQSFVKIGHDILFNTSSPCIPSGEYQFLVTRSDNCTSVSEIITMRVSPIDIGLTAGTDQILPCTQNFTGLAGVKFLQYPNNGTSCQYDIIWNTIDMPIGATDPINASNQNDLNAQLVNLIPGTYCFEINLNREPYQICNNFVKDTVYVTVSNAPPPSQFITASTTDICGGEPVTLTGTLNFAGSGTWSVVNTIPTGGGFSFSSTTSTSTTFTPTSPNTTYNIAWTVVNGCGSTTSNFSLTTNGMTVPTLPIINNSDYCGSIPAQNFHSISANVTGGVWSSSNSDYPVTPNSSFVTVNFPLSAQGDRTTIFYTITNICGTFRDSVTLQAPGTPPAPNIQTTSYCNTLTYPLTITLDYANGSFDPGLVVNIIPYSLSGTNPTVSVSRFTTNSSGVPLTPITMTFYGPGTYSLVHEIGLFDGCPPYFRTTQFNISSPVPFSAQAGSDVRLCGTNTSTLLSGMPNPAPSGYQTAWSIVSQSGAPITLQDYTSPTTSASFAGGMGGSAVLRYLVLNPVPACPSSFDDLTVTYTPNAEIGDIELQPCYNSPETSTSINLFANFAANSTGTWSITSQPAGSSPNIANPNTNTTQLSNLTAGTYALRWTINDGNGCTSFDEVNIVVASPCVFVCTPPMANCTVTSNVTSCTNPNGIATASSNVPNPIYNWSNGQMTNSIFGLTVGTYTVTVTNTANSCTSTCEVSISSTATPPTVTCAKVDNTNCTNPNGSASATATNVTYAWSNGATSAMISGLAAGPYTVTVTDITTSCTATCSVTVAMTATPPSVTCAKVDNTNCTNPNGSASATATNVTYAWSNGATSAMISGLAAGPYTVTVTDITTSCTATCSVTVAMTATPPSVTCAKVDNTNCTNPNGSASATATNVTYAWSNGATSAMISGLAAGPYTVTVTDLNTSCTATCSVTVAMTATPPSVTCAKVDNTNCTNPNGSASATATNVTYAWSNGATSAMISGLAAGPYTVTVTDITTSCTATCSVTVAMTATPPTVTCAKVDNTNCTNPNGSASATATNVTYAWSNGATSAMISGLAAGPYTVTVTDITTSCTATCSVQIGNAAINPTADCLGGVNSNCTNPNGSVSVLIDGMPRTYLWSTGVSTSTITDLPIGTYTVTVTNTDNMCTNTCEAEVTSAIAPHLCSINIIDQPSCQNLTGGNIAVTNNPTGTYNYMWSDLGPNSSNRTGLVGGTYTVTTTNTVTGCTAVCEVTLDTPMNCCQINTISPQSIICFDNGTPSLITDNRIRFSANVSNTNSSLLSYNITINGGTTITPNTNVPYGVTQFTLGPGSAGGGATFTVTVTDSSTPGCTQNIIVTDPGNCVNTAVCPEPKCGSATITPNGN